MEASVIGRLQRHLQSRESAIVDGWWDRVCADETLGSSAKLTRQEFKDNIAATLKGLREFLDRGKIGSETAGMIADHGRDRWKQSFDMREFVRDWGHLHAILIEEFGRFFKNEGLNDRGVQTRAGEELCSFITESMSASVAEYERLRQFEAASLFQDIKRLRERDQKRVQQRAQSLREYAHDMRGSLTAIAGLGAVISPKLSGDNLVWLTDSLDQGVREIAEMLERLLELSGLEAGLETPSFSRVSVQSISEGLKVLLRPMAEEKSLELRIEGDPALEVETDPKMLRRILQNLLVNAVKYTREGCVTLRWESGQSESWNLIVEDSGPGIQADAGSLVSQQLNHSNVMRSTQKALEAEDDSGAWTGEGIGLSIVKRLCELLNISISVESEEGKGTRFLLNVPRNYDEAKGREDA